MDGPKVLCIDVSVVFIADALVGGKMSLSAQQWKRQSFSHGYLCLFEPIATGMSQNSQIFASEFHERFALESILGG